MVLKATSLCDPTTCPPGPVQAIFQYSNCTGDVYYQPANLPGTCSASMGTSTKYIITEDYFENRQYFGTEDCGADGRDYAWNAYRYPWGSCLLDTKRFHSGVAASGAVMFLSNVNASYESPQDNFPHDSAFPSIFDVQVSQPCYSTDNCTFNGELPLTWTSSYSSTSCLLEGGESFMFANLSAGACYRNSEYYTMMECTDENTITIKYLTGHGCERYVFAQIDHAKCGPASRTARHCTAVPPTPTPASAAPSILSYFHVVALFVSLFLSLY